MQSEFKHWATGYGPISHSNTTQERIQSLIHTLNKQGLCTPEKALALLAASDRLCSAAMWLTVHMTYARNVYLDGRELLSDDFKPIPEGHTGGALNMVPAYVGYLLANALTGDTRSWMMGQGHCVAAIDATNILTGNTEAEQSARYPFTNAGLSQLCQDFYSYEVGPDGRPVAPLGSHVNPYTAGGISEGGYLGFAALEYMHMPLPNQQLVAFLSDGAFEEQRGSDWAARWWRGEDSGLVMPIMIANGRRIDQRSTLAQIGGVHWFREHLQLNGFEPVDIDGRDPAAFAWAIITMAQDLAAQHQAVKAGEQSYPIKLPYAIAETIKGFGFPGAGTNAAHNLPLDGNPHEDPGIAEVFNMGTDLLYVPEADLRSAVATLSNHSLSGRIAEKDHPLRKLNVADVVLPEAGHVTVGKTVSPMEQVDLWFATFVKANPEHRFRIGNPDELRSNRLNKTLDLLKHRVTAPEAGIAEAKDGKVITALNEEAVISAALANKQGVNLAISYEAFAVKMLGAMRQQVIFARHALETGRSVDWLTVPVIATSHTWENGKNEQSHQDPTLCEAWLQEMSDVAPVLFPIDANTAIESMRQLYGQRGRIATLVIPKGKVAVVTEAEQATTAIRQGFCIVRSPSSAQIQLIAIGAYQLQQALRAAERLAEHDVHAEVLAIIEPGRFRYPRDKREAEYVYDRQTIATLIPACEKRLFIGHCHAEPLTGVLRTLDLGPESSRFIGYHNRGGTLDVFGMQFANRQTWAHLLLHTAELLEQPLHNWLSDKEQAALNCQADPRILD